LPPSIPISTNVEDLTRRVEWLQGEVERLSAVIKGWTRGGFTNPVFRYMQAESVSFRFLASEGDIIYRDTRGRLTRLAPEFGWHTDVGEQFGGNSYYLIR